MYFILDNRSLALHPSRHFDDFTVECEDLWWDDGVSFSNPPKAPIEAKLEPFNCVHPEMSEEIPEAFFESIPLFRDDLIKALNDSGVDNLDCYEAKITDPDSGRIYTNFKGVNIIGIHRVADLKKSIKTIHDGVADIDVSFDKLVLDLEKLRNLNILMFRLEENNGAILVHESVKDFLVSKGFKIEFYALDEAAI